MNSIETYGNYLFVFAHPDDEVYCCGLMNRLVGADKQVSVVFLTSGDAGVNADLREQEIAASMHGIGIDEQRTHLLRIPEKAVLYKLSQTALHLAELCATVKPDCVVGMDYEGGHEVHDATSYVTSFCVASHPAAHYVFPVYHHESGRRVAACFLPSRMATDVVPLGDREIDVKIRVLEAHRGQMGHFLHLQKHNPDYFKTILSREVFRRIETAIDYEARPWTEIGYESHRNGFKFADFVNAIQHHRQAVDSNNDRRT